MKVGYICDYCSDYNRKIFTKKEAIEHEKECHFNPANKHCLTCRLFGDVPYQTTVDGITFMTSTRSCTANHIPIKSNMVFNCEFYEEEK